MSRSAHEAAVPISGECREPRLTRQQGSDPGRDQRDQSGGEILNDHRLCEHAVHAGFQAPLVILLHRVRRVGKDRRMTAGGASILRMAAVAARPSMTGIWTSMSTRS